MLVLVPASVVAEVVLLLLACCGGGDVVAGRFCARAVAGDYCAEDVPCVEVVLLAGGGR